jgi:hypothetical protein
MVLRAAVAGQTRVSAGTGTCPSVQSLSTNICLACIAIDDAIRVISVHLEMDR